MNKRLPILAISFLALTTIFAQQKLNISELDLSLVKQPYTIAAKDQSITGESIILGGVNFNTGIGTMSQSVIKLSCGDGERFSSTIGLIKSTQNPEGIDVVVIPLADGQRTFYKRDGEKKQFIGIGGNSGVIEQGSAIFKLLGDGKEIYSSPILTPNSKAIDIDVDIKGVKILELVVEDGGDGLSGDNAIWADPIITYKDSAPKIIKSDILGDVEMPSSELTKMLLAKSKTLKSATLPLTKSSYDWLIERDRAKAEVMTSNDGKELILTNGLVARVFRISPMVATIDYLNLMSDQTMLRAVSNEGVLKIDGKEYPLGGVDGQFEFGYIKREWIEDFVPAHNSFKVVDFEVSELTPRIKWAKSRWAGNKKDVTGKVLTFTLQHSAPEISGVIVKIHYALYDGMPLLSKWIEVENDSELPINIDKFKVEQLAMVEPDSPVELQKGDPRFMTPNIHIESDWAFRGFAPRESDVTEYWVEDPRYTSQCNYPMVTPCLLEVKLPLGPDETIKSGDKFSTFRVWEMPFDSDSRERKGLFTRQMYRNISPWLTENPIFMHCTSSDDKIVKEAIDQCAECGYEMVILSFGSGLNMEDESEANYAKFKALNDYAESKGVQLGGYSLLSSRWISDDVDVINPKTGKRGGMIFGSSPCLSSDWGYDYFRKIKKFYEKTGMSLFENDGSYPGNVCASTTHAHHKGLDDSQWQQRKQIENLYQWMCEEGIYTNIPDIGYIHNGGTKVGIGYREVNWSLPRERQLVLGRQINYDGLWERIPSMCWTFVPLTQYHGGGAAATLEPLSEHLKDYKAHMIQNYGAGIQACYRGYRLYDTEETKNVVKEVISWYKEHRYILNSDLIHIRRADGRDYDGFIHVNPDLEEKALMMIFNPLNETIEREIEVPLYYTGAEGTISMSENGAKYKKYKLNDDKKATITVKIEPQSYSYFIFK